MKAAALQEEDRQGRRLHVVLAVLLAGIVFVPVWVTRPDISSQEIRHFRWPATRAVPRDDTGVVAYWRWSRSPSDAFLTDFGDDAEPPPESASMRLMRWTSALMPMLAGLLVIVGARAPRRWRAMTLLLSGSALVTMPLWAEIGIEFGARGWWDEAVWLPQFALHEHYWGFWWPFSDAKPLFALMALAVGGHRAAATTRDPRIRRAAAVVFGLPLLLLLARQVSLLVESFGWDCLWKAHRDPGEEALLVLAISPALLVLLWVAMLGVSALSLVNAWAGKRGVARLGFAIGLGGLVVGLMQALVCAAQGGLLALGSHPVIDPFLDQGYLLHADLPFAAGLVFLAGGFKRQCHLNAGRWASSDSAARQSGERVPSSSPP